MSWEQLLGIRAEQADNVRAEPELRRQACPNDGTPYRTGPHGELYCPHDGYRPGST